MSIWQSFVREAEVGTGFIPPDIADDLYDAVVEAVGEPHDQPNPFNPDKPRTVFTVDWRVTGSDYDGVQLRQWIRIPESFMEFGLLDERSTLYTVLEALGYDLSGRFIVNPPEWVGRAARIMVENRANSRGETRPQVTKVMPPRQTAQGAAAQQAPAQSAPTQAPAPPAGRPAASQGARPAQRQNWPPRAS